MTVVGTQREYSETVPMQYEDGFEVFMGLEIKVDPRVLIPRPETEILVRASLEELSLKKLKEYSVIDMCTGSGVVAIALSRLVPGLKVKAVDVSKEALDLAEENVINYGLSGSIELVVSDMFSCFGSDQENIYDAIISNPPYVSDRDFELLDPWVKAEPALALYAGKNGMDYLSVLCAQSGKFLKSGGFLAVEMGYDQSRMVRDRMVENGFVEIKILKDHSGYDRVMIGRKNG